MDHAVVGTYNGWLIATSFIVAIATSYTAVGLAGRITANSGFARRAWLTGGAVAMGSGIWCMHYIGMLAYHLNIPVFYHIPTVLLSLIAAVLASLIALYVTSRDRMIHWHVILGSLAMGGGIAAMHYIGMAAMRMNAMHEYHKATWILSIALSVVISYVGLTLLFYIREDNSGKISKLMVALVLGLAIPTMHYTGMAAVSFHPMNGTIDYSRSIGISSLANFGIFGLTSIILGFALMTSVIDRRMAEQHLILENERKMLRALIDHIPDRMYVKDAQGRLLLANAQLARSLGIVDPQLLIGKTDFDFYPEHLAKAFREDELRVMLSGESLSEHEEVGIDATGNIVPTLVTKVPLRDSKGQITGIAGVARDISERKRSEEALRQAELKYRIMFNEALVGIFKLDSLGHLLQVNPAMAEFLGYDSSEDMLASITGPLWSRAASADLQAEFMTTILATGSARSYELEVFRKDGSKIWISSSVRAKMRDGVAVEFVGMFEDISERRVLREQLLQAQKLESVGQLAAGIAHEINTPVQYIGDNVRFLKDTFLELMTLTDAYEKMLASLGGRALGDPSHNVLLEAIQKVDTDYLFEEIPKAIEQTLEGITRVSGLVSAMKEFSHPGTGDKVPLDLNHAIENTITVARNEWKYVADINTGFDADLPLVSCLPGEFNQVVLNLIVNAAHAIAEKAAKGGPSKGSITIKTHHLPGWAEIRIEDSGGGIPESVRSRIFDPFFTTKEIGKGTGQGLAIARSVVVDKHQGSITFETKEGCGTTFIIRLPCVAVQDHQPLLAAV